MSAPSTDHGPGIPRAAPENTARRDAGRPIGLLAGSGRFPIVFAEKTRRLGIPVVCVGIRHEASAELAGMVGRFYWSGVARLGRMIRCFRRERVERIVMAGKITKAVMHKPWRMLQLLPDWRTLRAWYRKRPDNRDDTMLLRIIDEFAADGMRFDSALDLCPELLVRPGVLTRRKPTTFEEADIAFGWELAKEMGRLDVGQSVAVKERAVLAVEAIEGTDRAIARAGELCGAGGFVVVKVAKPQQDMRFDVPTIGCATVETLRKAGGRVLAVEAGKTIILDEADTVALADRYGITIVACR
jgi:UDP-2,3-diacylglucosamine hydrolase